MVEPESDLRKPSPGLSNRVSKLMSFPTNIPLKLRKNILDSGPKVRRRLSSLIEYLLSQLGLKQGIPKETVRDGKWSPRKRVDYTIEFSETNL